MKKLLIIFVCAISLMACQKVDQKNDSAKVIKHEEGYSVFLAKENKNLIVPTGNSRFPMVILEKDFVVLYALLPFELLREKSEPLTSVMERAVKFVYLFKEHRFVEYNGYSAINVCLVGPDYFGFSFYEDEKKILTFKTYMVSTGKFIDGLEPKTN